MGRRGAAIGRPSGYGTLASELLDIGERREVKGERLFLVMSGRRGAAIGRPLGYGTPRSGYRTPFGLWDAAERLSDALRAMGYWLLARG